MDEEIEEMVVKFLNYSFGDIHYNYNGLTDIEKSFATREQFDRLIDWVRKKSKG